VPVNGLVVYCGTVMTEEGKEKKVNIDFEPFRPINTSLYLCDNKFHTEVWSFVVTALFLSCFLLRGACAISHRVVARAIETYLTDTYYIVCLQNFFPILFTSFFISFIVYFLPYLFTCLGIGLFRFQARDRKRQPNPALFCVICFLTESCLLLLCLF